MKRVVGLLVVLITFALGFFGGVAFTKWTLSEEPFVTTKPVTLVDSRSNATIALPAGIELYRTENRTGFDIDDYEWDVLIRARYETSLRASVRRVTSFKDDALPGLSLQGQR